jgi:hypothetical protein
MVENVWIEDDDCVITKMMMDNFEKLIEFQQWMLKNHPDIVNDWKKQSGQG